MKKIYLLSALILLMTCLSCGSKKDAFDTSRWYFKIKVDNEWREFKDDIGANLATDWNGNNRPHLAFGGGSNTTGEYMLFNYDLIITKYGSDSLPISPKMEYSFRYFEYKIGSKRVIYTPQSGWDDGAGTFNLTEFKVIDTTAKFAGYFRGKMSYKNDAGNTVTITEGQFNLPRNDQKVNN